MQIESRGGGRYISMSHLPNPTLACLDNELFCERAFDKIGEVGCFCRLSKINLKEPNLLGSNASSSVSIASWVTVGGTQLFKGVPGKDEGKEVT